LTDRSVKRQPAPPRWDTVLASAAELFAANGFAATSVRQIARRARLSKPGLYYHIRGKEDLLARLCESSMAGILAGVRAAVAAARDPEAGLRAAIGAHLEYHWRHPHNLSIVFGQTPFLSPERRRRVVALEREYLDLVRGVIRDGQRRGAFRGVDATVAAFSLFALLNGFDAWYDPRGRIGPRALQRHLERLYLSGLTGGRRAP
jgi:AcrR family transcriptional regulator